MRTIVTAAVLVGTVGLVGCADMSAQQQRTLSGAGIGAAAGTVVGALSGATLWGAALGTAAGAAGGFIWDQHKQAQDRAYQQGYAAGQRSATATGAPKAN